MIQLTSYEIDDLKYCHRELRRVLLVLDTAGAGIAAIHVNAAIEQLNKNLHAIGQSAKSDKPASSVSFLFPDENS